MAGKTLPSKGFYAKADIFSEDTNPEALNRLRSPPRGGGAEVATLKEKTPGERIVSSLGCQRKVMKRRRTNERIDEVNK